MTFVDEHIARCRALREASRPVKSVAIRATRHMTVEQKADYLVLRRAGFSVREAVAKVAGERL